MKNVILLFCMMTMWATVAQAQLQTPASSPLCVIDQKVGLTDVTIEYSRPGAKGREIFGDLVPFGEMWRTGANASTKIEFSDAVAIDGNEINAGKYALYTIPGVDEWTIILNTNTTLWGIDGYQQEEDVLRIKVPSGKTDYFWETFTINPNNIRNNSASIDLCWENTVVSIPLEVNTNAIVEASIEKVMSGPSGSDYYRAASYYLEEEIDLVQAYVWIQKAAELEGDKFWIYRKQSLIEAKLGQYKKAIQTAKKSLKLAKEADNKDYVKINEENIEKWSAKM